MESEAGLVELHLSGQRSVLIVEDVHNQQVSYKVQEDERTSSRTESYMLTSWLDLEASAHRSFDVEGLIGVGIYGLLSISDLGSVDTRGQTLRHLVGLKGQFDPIHVFPNEKSVVEVRFLVF